MQVYAGWRAGARARSGGGPGFPRARQATGCRTGAEKIELRCRFGAGKMHAKGIGGVANRYGMGSPRQSAGENAWQ